MNDAYIGFMIFSRKNCGTDFLVSFGDGRVTFGLADKIQMYQTESYWI